MQSAEEILAVRPHRASVLFGDSPERAFRRLAKDWHPDVSAHPRASAEIIRADYARAKREDGYDEN